jgi:hypothetical protein
MMRRGLIAYYSYFYKTHLHPTLKRIDVYVIRWARRNFKRLRHQIKNGARDIGNGGSGGGAEGVRRAQTAWITVSVLIGPT